MYTTGDAISNVVAYSCRGLGLVVKRQSLTIVTVSLCSSKPNLINHLSSEPLPTCSHDHVQTSDL